MHSGPFRVNADHCPTLFFGITEGHGNLHKTNLTRETTFGVPDSLIGLHLDPDERVFTNHSVRIFLVQAPYGRHPSCAF